MVPSNTKNEAWWLIENNAEQMLQAYENELFQRVSRTSFWISVSQGIVANLIILFLIAIIGFALQYSNLGFWGAVAKFVSSLSQ